jgi:hypothetical protein
VRPLEHANDPPDAPARALLLGTQDHVGDFGVDGAALSEVGPIAGKQAREATSPVRPVPIFPPYVR